MTDAKEDVGATAFDLPNGQHPFKENHIRYGNQHVPKPNNKASERTNHAKVMGQTREAR